jgi:glycosyltransferase involved in cell wall biosynthesis
MPDFADVSVVIPTYNRAALLLEAIDSVLRQTLPVREVIIVDDGSSDGTPELVRGRYPQVRVLTQKNGGPSAARNLAIREAQGAWLAFLDDDDVWLEQKIELQWREIRSWPRAAIAYCADFAVDERLAILRRRDMDATCVGDVFDRLLVRNFLFTSCVMARRDAVIEAGQFDPGLRFGEDWDLWLRLAALHEVCGVAQPLVYYRHFSAGCLTKDLPAPQRMLDVETILDRALKLRAVRPEVVRRARHRAKCLLADAWLAVGQKRRAMQAAVQAVSFAPLAYEGYRLLAHALVPRRPRAAPAA